MISQIIEARPEDLRIYLEEAAGISKYKERRKETESRIRHTQENLDRLNDLREEIGKQLEHLKRQARQAEQISDIAAKNAALKMPSARPCSSVNWTPVSKDCVRHYFKRKPAYSNCLPNSVKPRCGSKPPAYGVKSLPKPWQPHRPMSIK